MTDPPVVIHGDCLDVLKTLPADSVDAVVTDPPAGISFMGRDWDGNKGGRAQWSAWLAEVMTECLRVAKPGAHALVWALPRTSHWTACGIEDAGWELRDRITHLFGTGFPKSLNLGDGRGTALKPAVEDWWLARKPLTGTAAANVQAHGTGALNIDACRVAMSDADRDFILKTARPNSAGLSHVGAVMNRPATPTVNVHSAGRWPPNVVMSHAVTPEGEDACAHGCVPECPVAELNGQSGVTSSWMPNSNYAIATKADVYGKAGPRPVGPQNQYGDTGGASRFFPTFRYEAKAPTSERPKVNGVAHPCVKPLELMRWLVRLVTPPGGTVLDPFAGSGTTAEACLAEGFGCITIERDPTYLPLIEARLAKATQPALL